MSGTYSLDDVANMTAAPSPKSYSLSDVMKMSDEPSSTTASGIAASAARGAAPVAAGALAGAALGAPFAGVGAIPGAAAGAGAVLLSDAVGGGYNILADHMGWPKTDTPQQMTDRVLDWAGLKRPLTTAERMTETTASGLSGGIAGPVAAASFAERASPSVAKEVAGTFATSPAKQAVAGALGSGASQTVAELGGGPLAQTLAAMAAAGAPYAKGAVLAGARSSASDAARRSIDAGYVFPPSEIPKMGDGASLPSAAASGVGGKIKMQQLASTKNQAVTNRIAAEEIGLPPGTMLTDQSIEHAKAAPSAVYQEVAAAVPEVTFGPEFQRGVSNIGGRNSMVEKIFPSTGNNPGISALRDELERNSKVKTDVAMKYVADLRFNAGQNLKAVGDAQKHRLGLAQREAADLVENAIENSVKNAPQYFSERFNKTITKLHETQKKYTEANMRLTKARADLSTTFDIYKSAAAQKEANRAAADVEKTTLEFNKARTELDQVRTRLQQAHADAGKNKTLLDRYKDARKTFAKIYTVDDATNRTTGDVSAPGLARAYQKGMPLSDGLKTIAEAAQTAPKSMQVPALFGRSEDYSALDFFGTAIAAAHGNVPAAMGILTRPYIRGTLLSPAYQRAIIAQHPFSVPLPVMQQAVGPRATLDDLGESQ